MAEHVFPPDSADYQAAGRAQAIAADPDHSAWVSANAGSGKTKVLIDRVARLLLKGARPDSILCITYTRAAANEMISRLFRQLGAWSVMEDSELAGRLAALEARQADSYADAEIKHARALFARALETPGGLRIETIHAFCARLLRRFPLEAEISPGFRDLEERDAERLWQTAIRASLIHLAEQTPEMVRELTLEGGGFGLGAALGLVRGSGGKLALDPDMVREELCAALGAPNMPAEAILQKAVIEDLPTGDYQQAIETLRQGSANDLKLAAKLTEMLNTSDAAARMGLLRTLWTKSDGTPREKSPYTKKVASMLDDLLATSVPEGREITRLRSAETAWHAALAVDRTVALVQLAGPILAGYATEKAARGALDFEDLIGAARHLLTRSGMAAWVLYKLDGGISHVLLDEAQDTSPDQWDLIRTLTAEFFAGMGSEHAQDPRTLFVVGDEKQSIYSFQGAEPREFLAGRQAFSERTLGTGQTPDMNMSFRSSPEVLHFVDTVFESDRFDGAPFSEMPPEEADLMVHTARRANQPGCVEVWPMEAPIEPDTDDPWEPPVNAMSEDAPKARLAAEVAQAVAGLIARKEAVWTENDDRSWSRRPAGPGDVLILVRKRKGGLFDALIQNLKKCGLPVAGADRLTLADHIGVQDLLNLIRFALFPEDDLTLAEILRGPFCDLVDDDRHLFPLAHGRGQASLWSRLQAHEDLAFQPAKAFLEAVQARRDMPPFEFLTAVLDRPVLDTQTGWDRIGARLGTPARDPVEALLSRALAHDSAAGASLQTFLIAMERDESEIKRDLAEAGGAVRVMTVHGAKGLQAPIVILPDTTAPPPAAPGSLLSVNGLPVWAPRKDEDTDRLAAARLRAAARAQEEARRLLYVALTRAQDRLVICGAWHGRKTGAGFDPASWYGLCANAMERLAEPVSEESGIVRFGEVPPPAAESEASAEHRPTAPAWLRRPAPEESAGSWAVSPSRLMPDDTPVIDPLGPRPPDHRLRGRLIHALLERLPRLEAADQAAAAETYLARETALSDSERTEIRDTVLATLRDPAMAEVFAPEGRAEAAIVGTGTGWPPGIIINGRVDRLIVREGSILIVDIKTDRPPPRDESGVGEAYLRQMATYANVLATGFPSHEINCALVWTQGPRLMPLSQASLLAALKRAQSGL
ncbi:MAG: double-strand break repair helicase AddA [Hyphomonadaceae bacterium]|nr:double-strand break repair helicase AddA [Hyphomonadaceae bacterium]